MKDKIGEASEQIVYSERNGAVWTRYDRYEPARRDGERWIEARGQETTYRPLVEGPGLFNALATMGRRVEDPTDPFQRTDDAIEFARGYGVLGFAPPQEFSYRKPSGGLVLLGEDDPGDLLWSVKQGNRRSDSVARFVWEAWHAWAARTFYEAAMKPEDEGSLETIHSLASRFAYVYYGDELGDQGLMMFDPEGWVADGAAVSVEAKVWGLNAAAEIAQGRVSAWCFPAIFRRDGRRLERGWGFKNLAGAAWLQFYWKLTADDDTRFCRNPECPNGNPVIIDDPHKTGPRPEYCPHPDDPSKQSMCRKHASYLRRRAKAST